MKKLKLSKKPNDSNKRKKNNPVICYPLNNLKVNHFPIYQKARKETKIINEIIVSIEYVKGIIIILFDNVPSKFILSLIALFRLSFSFTIISNSNDK